MPVDEVQNAADIGLFERIEKGMVCVLLATGVFEAPANIVPLLFDLD